VKGQKGWFSVRWHKKNEGGQQLITQYIAIPSQRKEEKIHQPKLQDLPRLEDESLMETSQNYESSIQENMEEDKNIAENNNIGEIMQDIDQINSSEEEGNINVTSTKSQ